MDTIIQYIEIFALVTGVIYVILEIMQRNAMWMVGILTASACAFSFGVQHVWASMGLNIYYVVMSVIGLYQWRKAGKQVEEGEIHLKRLTPRVSGISSGLLVLLSSALIPILRAMGLPKE